MYLCAAFSNSTIRYLWILRMNLIIDIGNTRAKMALFNQNTLVEKTSVAHLTREDLVSFLEKNDQNAPVEAAILSASGQNTEGVLDWLRKTFFFIEFSHQTPIPIENHYGTPETLGKDRLAGAVAAAAIFPEKNVLFMDGGTCLTYNLVNKNGHFLGGNIAPGLSMRLKAMHQFTARLPLLTADATYNFDEKNWVGKTTQQAMLNGAHIGIVAEIEGFAQHFSAQFADLQLIITGGDGAFLAQHCALPHLIFNPNLVLEGLNHILNFNLKK